MDLTKLIRASGLSISPGSLRFRQRLVTAAAFVAFAVAAFLLYLRIHSLLVFGCLPGAALVGAAYPVVWLRSAASTRARMCERELPFVSTLLAIAANHSPPSRTLMTTGAMPSMSWTQREYVALIKISKIMRSTLGQAAYELSTVHPSQRFSALLRSVSAAERGLGDPYYTMRDSSRAELSALRQEAELSSEKLGVASSTVLVAFAVAPLSVLVFAAITSQSFFVYFGSLLSLPSAVLVDMMVTRAYPETLRPCVRLPGYWILATSIGSGLAAIFAPLPFSVPFYMRLGGALVFGSLVAGLSSISQERAHTTLLRNLPALSRDFAEEAKKGVPPSAAIPRLKASLKYPAILFSTLSGHAPKPYLAQAYLDLAKESERLGADTESLEAVSDAVNTVASIHSSYLSKASFFRMTAFASAAILASSSAIVLHTFSSLSSHASGGYLPPSLVFVSFNPAIAPVVFAAVVLNSYLLGVLAGKALRGSLLYGLRDGALGALLAMVIISVGMVL